MNVFVGARSCSPASFGVSSSSLSKFKPRSVAIEEAPTMLDLTRSAEDELRRRGKANLTALKARSHDASVGFDSTIRTIADARFG